MLGSMSEQIRDCYEHAEECARKAAAQIARRGSIAMPTPVTARAETDSAALSIHVFREGSRFSWTICSPSEEMLGGNGRDRSQSPR